MLIESYVHNIPENEGLFDIIEPYWPILKDDSVS